MRLRKLAFLIGFGVLIASCTPTQVAVVSSPTPRLIVPTRATPTPSFTPTATETPTPTETPTATPTNTPTETPTLTPSPTDTPTTTPDEPVAFTSSTAFWPVPVESSIPFDTILFNTLRDDYPAALYSFSGTAGMSISVTMQAQDDGDLDPMLLILDSKGREHARSDDRDDDPSTAQIQGLTLPETGDYFVVATRSNGVFGLTEGSFSVVLTQAASDTPPAGLFSTMLAYEASASGTINAAAPQHLYTFRGTAGDVISIQLSAISGNLDTRLFLTDNLGNILQENDDDQLTRTFDSQIQAYILPYDGYYSVLASRYEPPDAPADDGDFRLKLSLDQRGQRSVLPPLFAPLNTVNSRTIRTDGQFFSNYSIGDMLDDTDTELRLQTLLTFALPPLQNGIARATLEMTPCRELGRGFTALGELTVYQDNYGGLADGRNLSRPFPGARVLSTQTSCDPIDVTQIVTQAYEAGTPQVQFRLIFRDSATNGQRDEVLLTPRLRIEREN